MYQQITGLLHKTTLSTLFIKYLSIFFLNQKRPTGQWVARGTKLTVLTQQPQQAFPTPPEIKTMKV